MRLVHKLLETLRFARYGPTRVASLEGLFPLVQSMQEAIRTAGAVDEARRAEQARVNEGLQEQLAQAFSQLAAQAAAHAQSERQNAAAAQAVREELQGLRAQLLGMAAALDRVAAAPPRAPHAVPASAAALEESFYPLLEAHFRGSEGDVEARLCAYREWVDAMPAGTIADIGCGRGEWLSLLARWGRKAVGVDSNALVVAELRDKGVQVDEADAIEWLNGRPAACFAGVTVFHVVEHLPFGVILRLMLEAHRVLVPGGKLVIETPNPENVTVSTHSFWLDPTHLRPLPPQLLQLALRFCGFEPPTVLRLHPPEDGSGPGRDYALIAGKAAAQ